MTRSRSASNRPVHSEGVIHVHPAGYGFVERVGEDEDLYVPKHARGTALDKDRVRVSIVDGPRGPEARVEKVVERGRTKITGVLRVAGRSMMIDPDDPRIAGATAGVVVEGNSHGARHGQAVVLKIDQYPSTGEDVIYGQIVRVLGNPEEPVTEIAKTLAVAEIEEGFPESVLTEAAAMPTELRATDREGVQDLRQVPFLTIDPPDARDHDDAVAVEGSRLWVAIADVSHYVRPGSAIDRAARARAMTVYLPSRAIPMLPEVLSSGVCSLRSEERLAMVVRIDFDAKGAPHGTTFAHALIQPRAVLNYDQVASGKTGAFEKQIAAMRHLATLLNRRRVARGALELDVPEAKVLLQEDDPLRVRDVVRTRATPRLREAYNIIEEFMLAANEAVARFFRAKRHTTLWRVHDVPDEDRIAAFSQIAEALGEPFTAGKVTSKKVSAFLKHMKGRPLQAALSMLLLRALAQAHYDIVNVGHFGLGTKNYLHFTSPIRRYPDLIVHRLLKAHLGLAKKRWIASKADLTLIAEETSKAERVIVSVEREIVDLYRAYLMRDRIGDEFDAIITGVGGMGLFVETHDPYIDGLVRVSELKDDFYEADEAQMRLVGRETGKVFTIGDGLRVRCEDASISRRKVDFVPAWDMDTARRRRAKGGPRGPKRRSGKRR